MERCFLCLAEFDEIDCPKRRSCCNAVYCETHLSNSNFLSHLRNAGCPLCRRMTCPTIEIDTIDNSHDLQPILPSFEPNFFISFENDRELIPLSSTCLRAMTIFRARAFQQVREVVDARLGDSVRNNQNFVSWDDYCLMINSTIRHTEGYLANIMSAVKNCVHLQYTSQRTPLQELLFSGESRWIYDGYGTRTVAIMFFRFCVGDWAVQNWRTSGRRLVELNFALLDSHADIFTSQVVVDAEGVLTISVRGLLFDKREPPRYKSKTLNSLLLSR